MIRRPPRSTRTDTLFPYTTLFRSAAIPLLHLALLDRRVPVGQRVEVADHRPDGLRRYRKLGGGTDLGHVDRTPRCAFFVAGPRRAGGMSTVLRAIAPTGPKELATLHQHADVGRLPRATERRRVA